MEGENILVIHDAGNQETEYKVTAFTCSGLRNRGQATFLLGYSCECWCHLQNFWLYENLGLCWGKNRGAMDEGNFLSPETVDWMVFLPQHELLKQAFRWVGPWPPITAHLMGTRGGNDLQIQGAPFSVGWSQGQAVEPARTRNLTPSPVIAVYSLVTGSFHNMFKPGFSQVVSICMSPSVPWVSGTSPRLFFFFFCTMYELMSQLGAGKGISLENL